MIRRELDHASKDLQEKVRTGEATAEVRTMSPLFLVLHKCKQSFIHFSRSMMITSSNFKLINNNKCETYIFIIVSLVRQELFTYGAIMIEKEYYSLAIKSLNESIEKWEGIDQEKAQIYNALGFALQKIEKVRKKSYLLST